MTAKKPLGAVPVMLSIVSVFKGGVAASEEDGGFQSRECWPVSNSVTTRLLEL